jgi:hypothetical protein
MLLSATAVTQGKSRPKPYKTWDERGLCFLITPKGSRYWRFTYRFAGKARTISLGVYPDVTLADARMRRDEARRLVAADEGPSTEEKRGVAACQSARKRDPRSASKRDPLLGYDDGLLRMALRCVRRRAGVARPEAHAAQDRFLKAPKVAVSCGF